nr:protein NYNRIN-like [Tanacetum cinerariifolium]
MILDLPALTTPFSKETLFVHLAISREAANAMLLVVRQGKQQPVHYVSRTLHAAERNYAPMEKMTLALRHASRRLRRYFEAHPITVITDQPIKQILSKADMSGRLAPYAVELGAYNIVYEPRNAIKCQKDCKEEWTLYTDRAASAKGSGVGLVLISPTKTEYTYALRLNFESTNNQAEYEALLARLRIAKKMGVQSLSIKVDYKLVASQINGNYEACKKNMIRYLNKVKEYIGCFKNFKIQNIPRNKNQKADVLSKLASVAFNHLTKEILVETLDVPSMDVQEINVVVEEEGETWMTPIINCLERGIWPKDQNEARALRIKISQLCRLRNSHGGMQHAPKRKIGGSNSNSPWGMDMLGPLPESSGKVRFMIVAVDYFTKWIEAKPLAKTTGKEVKKFPLRTLKLTAWWKEQIGALWKESRLGWEEKGKDRKTGSEMGRTIPESGSISEWLIQAAYRGRRGGAPRLACD